MRGPIQTPLAETLPATVPFVGPEAQERERGRAFAARLGANENLFGPSPKAVAAMQDATREVWKYGDPQSHDLITALAEFHGVAPENVVVGEGIDALLGYLVRLLAAPGDRVVTSLGAYPTFNYHVAGFGAELVSVSYVDDREDPAALVGKVGECGAKLVYFANPDNPMGTWQDARTVQQSIAQIPDGCVMVLDEAYVEFAPRQAVPPLDVSDPAIIRMRTFSKAYGMAGARIGYAIGHRDLIAAFDKIRNHFGVNRIAQSGALAALADQDHLQATLDQVAAARAEISRIARTNGLQALPSATNFVAVDCGSDGDFARAVLRELIQRDIFVRMPFVAPQDRCIRISAGPDAELRAFEDALPQALEAARRSHTGS